MNWGFYIVLIKIIKKNVSNQAIILSCGIKFLYISEKNRNIQIQKKYFKKYCSRVRTEFIRSVIGKNIGVYIYIYISFSDTSVHLMVCNLHVILGKRNNNDRLLRQRVIIALLILLLLLLKETERCVLLLAVAWLDDNSKDDVAIRVNFDHSCGIIVCCHLVAFGGPIKLNFVNGGNPPPYLP